MSRAPSLERAAPRVDLTGTAGFLVADARGRVVGRVEGPMYGGSPEIPDALSVRFKRTRVIGLRIERAAIRAFL